MIYAILIVAAFAAIAAGVYFWQGYSIIEKDARWY